METNSKEMNPKLRLQVLERDNFTCQYQECKRESLDLEVHHIISRRSGGTDSLDNLIIYCKNCHKKVEPTHIRYTAGDINMEWKIIRISEDNHRRLREKGIVHETMDEVIIKLLDFWEAKHKT